MVRVRAMLVIPATIVEVSIFVQTTAAAMADVKIGKKMHGWRPAHYFLFFLFLCVQMCGWNSFLTILFSIPACLVLRSECWCAPMYTGDDCSWAASCYNFCSGRGKCVSDSCLCDPLFTGIDCR